MGKSIFFENRFRKTIHRERKSNQNIIQKTNQEFIHLFKVYSFIYSLFIHLDCVTKMHLIGLISFTLIGQLFLTEAIPFASFHRTKPSHLDGYLKKLSSNYLQLIKNFLARKNHANTRRDLAESELENHFVASNKRSFFPRPSDPFGGYLRLLSSNYLNLITKYLANNPRVQTKRNNELLSLKDSFDKRGIHFMDELQLLRLAVRQLMREAKIQKKSVVTKKETRMKIEKPMLS